MYIIPIIIRALSMIKMNMKKEKQWKKRKACKSTQSPKISLFCAVNILQKIFPMHHHNARKEHSLCTKHINPVKHSKINYPIHPLKSSVNKYNILFTLNWITAKHNTTFVAHSLHDHHSKRQCTACNHITDTRHSNTGDLHSMHSMHLLLN